MRKQDAVLGETYTVGGDRLERQSLAVLLSWEPWFSALGYGYRSVTHPEDTLFRIQTHRGGGERLLANVRRIEPAKVIGQYHESEQVWQEAQRLLKGWYTNRWLPWFQQHPETITRAQYDDLDLWGLNDELRVTPIVTSSKQIRMTADDWLIKAAAQRAYERVAREQSEARNAAHAEVMVDISVAMKQLGISDKRYEITETRTDGKVVLKATLLRDILQRLNNAENYHVAK